MDANHTCTIVYKRQIVQHVSTRDNNLEIIEWVFVLISIKNNFVLRYNYAFYRGYIYLYEMGSVVRGVVMTSFLFFTNFTLPNSEMWKIPEK